MTAATMRLSRREKKELKQHAREALGRLDRTLTVALERIRPGFSAEHLERELGPDKSRPKR